MEIKNKSYDSHKIFWAQEKNKYNNELNVFNIYNDYIDWYKRNNKSTVLNCDDPVSSWETIDTKSEKPVNKYFFRNYIYKNGYKPIKRLELTSDANLVIPENFTFKTKLSGVLSIIKNKWFVISKKPMNHTIKIYGKRTSLFRWFPREDYYGIMDEIVPNDSYQRIMPLTKRDNSQLVGISPDQIQVYMKGSLMRLEKYNIADMRNHKEGGRIVTVWIKPTVSIYSELEKLKVIPGVIEVSMIEYSLT